MRRPILLHPPDTVRLPASSGSRAVSDAIARFAGRCRNTEPNRHHLRDRSRLNPDDEPVKAGVLRDLLEERAARQRLEANCATPAREQERAAQQRQPKAEDLLFRIPTSSCSRSKQDRAEDRATCSLNFDMQLATMRHGPMFDQAWQHFHATCQNGARPGVLFSGHERAIAGRGDGAVVQRARVYARDRRRSRRLPSARLQELCRTPSSWPSAAAGWHAAAAAAAAADQRSHAVKTDGSCQQQQPRHEVRLPIVLISHERPRAACRRPTRSRTDRRRRYSTPGARPQN